MLRTLIPFGIFVTALSGSVFADETKIGAVDVRKLLVAAPQAEAASKLLEREFGPRQQALVKSQKDIKAQEDKLSKDGPVMSDAERGKLERDIVNKKRDLKRGLPQN